MQRPEPIVVIGRIREIRVHHFPGPHRSPSYRELVVSIDADDGETPEFRGDPSVAVAGLKPGDAVRVRGHLEEEQPLVDVIEPLTGNLRVARR